MKILAVSLLRLGDIFLHQEILRDLKRIYPEAQIDLVINQQFKSVEGLIHEVDQIHLFPRTSLQRELIEAEGSVFRGFMELKDWIHRLNLEKYDLVFDLTHNFLSHKLIALVDAPDKRGSISGYFNDIYSVSKETSFHYVQALKTSLQLESPQRPRTVERRKIKKIAVQPLTSDQKKNWDLASYRRLVEILINEHPDYQVQILGAPFEEAVLRSAFVESERVKIEILGLQDLEFRLWDTGLLISGDTATIHLAALCRAPIVGLFLGSADPFKTAPWLEGAVVFHSQEACSPCGHVGGCGQKSHLCSENLRAEEVAEAISHYIRGGLSGLQFEAGQYSFAVYAQVLNGNNGLVLENLGSLEESVRACVRQLAWDMAYNIKGSAKNFSTAEFIVNRYLARAHELAIHVTEELKIIQFQQQILHDLERATQNLSRELLRNSEVESTLDEGLEALKVSVQEWQRMSPDQETSELLRTLLQGRDLNNQFSFYKSVRWTLVLVTQFLNQKNEIYKNLNSQLRERGYNYVSGPGKLS